MTASFATNLASRLQDLRREGGSRRTWLAIRTRLLSGILGVLFESRRRIVTLERIGSQYGGWAVPKDLISSEWICYCGGAGEDITFDLGIIERFGVHVYCFDPTPRSAAHVARAAEGVSRFHFYPVGLWDRNENVRFFAPRDPNHVSHSALNLQGTEEYFVAPCQRISSIMRELHHGRIDLLKIDIEGAEYAVLRSLLEDGLVVKVLCVEFDQPMPVLATARMILQLKRAGYQPVHAESWNYTFIHESAMCRS